MCIPKQILALPFLIFTSFLFSAYFNCFQDQELNKRLYMLELERFRRTEKRKEYAAAECGEIVKSIDEEIDVIDLLLPLREKVREYTQLAQYFSIRMFLPSEELAIEFPRTMAPTQFLKKLLKDIKPTDSDYVQQLGYVLKVGVAVLESNDNKL